jgi:hypothetical protein
MYSTKHLLLHSRQAARLRRIRPEQPSCSCRAAAAFIKPMADSKPAIEFLSNLREREREREGGRERERLRLRLRAREEEKRERVGRATHVTGWV